MDDLTPEQIAALIASLPTLPRSEAEALLLDLEEYETRKRLQASRDDFLLFCHAVYPGFKEGPHHRHLKPLLHGVSAGTEPRITCSMPPGYSRAKAGSPGQTQPTN